MRTHWRYYREGELAETRENGAPWTWNAPLVTGTADVAVDFAGRAYSCVGDMPSGLLRYERVDFKEPAE
jgi:hypothetical protein